MPFDRILTDTISLLKKNGDLTESIKASVQKEKIFVQRSDLLIESGDLILQAMSNGAEETYRVIDPGFHEKFHAIPAGYQMDVQKLGLPEAKSAVQNVTFNISGANNRINQNSTDNSINISNINPDVQDHLKALRDEVKNLGLSQNELTASYQVIDAVETQFNSDEPSKIVVKTLLQALPSAASVASIGSFIISCL